MAEISTGLVLQHCHVEIIMCSMIVSALINIHYPFYFWVFPAFERKKKGIPHAASGADCICASLRSVTFTQMGLSRAFKNEIYLRRLSETG